MGKKKEKSKDEVAKDEESGVAKIPYPKSIAFIVTNEFCERFSFYGMRTILSIYLADKLRYSDDDAVVIYHVFIMFVYFFPIFGAMIADSWLGRFKTIFFLSIVYAIGNILISLTAMPPLNIPDRAFTIVGLLLVAVGTGGIKPCVSAFGGDQFKMPEQAKQLATFFSLFYFAINSGSFVSTFVTPILRMDVHCFGDEDCYSLAFGVPGILMIVSIVVFLLGKPLYVMRKPAGNLLVQVFKCIGHAISRRRKLKKKEKRDHWLEYADDEFDNVFINDVKAALKVLLLFVPLPVFWALFDQQGSRWTFQATRMNGDLGGGFILKPDQMQVVNPLLILIFIPLFEVAIYPALKWCKIIRKPLHKMILGGMLAAVAFILSAVVEIELEKTYPILPNQGESHLRMYNGYNCQVNVKYLDTINVNYTMEALGSHPHLSVNFKKEPVTFTISKIGTEDCPGFPAGDSDEKEITLYDKTSSSMFISNGEYLDFIDNSDKSSKGNPIIRVLRSFDGTIIFQDTDSKENVLTISDKNATIRQEIKASTYNIKIGEVTIMEDQPLELGGVYAIIISKNTVKIEREDIYKSGIVEITPSNSVHMMWLLPQYIILTMGEVMFSVTGLEFSFTQAPASMKSVLTAGWLLTVAFGNLIVIIVAEAQGFSSQVDEFFLFAGLMVVDMIIFWLMTLKYKYVEVSPSSEDEPDVQKSPLPISDSPSDNNSVLRGGGDQNNQDPKPEEAQTEAKTEDDVVLRQKDEQANEKDDQSESDAKNSKDAEAVLRQKDEQANEKVDQSESDAKAVLRQKDEPDENDAKNSKDAEVLMDAEKRKGFIEEPSVAGTSDEGKSSGDDGELKGSDVAN